MKHNAYDRQLEGNKELDNIQSLQLDECTCRPMAQETYKCDGTYGIEYKRTLNALRPSRAVCKAVWLPSI